MPAAACGPTRVAGRRRLVQQRQDALPALAVFAQALVRSVPVGAARLEAERAAAQFQRQALAQLESIAAGKGEPPRILFQSSTLTPAGLARGRLQAQLELDHATQADR